MAMRRLAGLQSQLRSIACRCEQVVQAAAAGHVSASPLHITAPHALKLAAAALSRPPVHAQPFVTPRASYSAQAAAFEESERVDLAFTDAAVERLRELAQDTPDQPLILRLTVEGGGCSGFTYLFSLEQQSAPDDRVLTQGSATLVCDPISYDFVKGSTVDYTTDLIRSAFEVVSNPNAQQSCGCGSSFAPKG